MAENNNSSGGIGCLGLLAVLLTVLLVGLKLTGFITWSWLWVASPIPIALVLEIVLILLVFGGALGLFGIVAGIAALLDRHDRNKRLGSYPRLNLSRATTVAPKQERFTELNLKR